MSINILHIRCYERGKKDESKYYYRTFPLKIKGGIYGIDKGGNDIILLEGFSRAGLTLTK
jgi:hypothetical protein